jgi:uncharacterized protein YmfQ (DUF2313 family)
MAVGAEAYARQLKQLLPPGKLWLLEEDSVLSAFMLGLAEEFARVDARGQALLEEADPRTSTELLAEWERVLGLPDDAVLSIPSTEEGRRLAVVTKLLATGGQSKAYFQALAAVAGYSVSIYDAFGLTVARVGRTRAGQRCVGTAWAHTWRVTVSPPTGPALTTQELERFIRRAAPAHTAVIFTYL